MRDDRHKERGLIADRCGIFVLLYVLLILSGCDMVRVPKLTGSLIFLPGNNEVHSLTFDGGDIRHQVLFKSSEDSNLGGITNVVDQELLLQDCAPKRVPNCEILKMNLWTKKEVSLRTGMKPTYVAPSGRIFFFDSVTDSNGKWLLMTSQESIQSPVRIAEAPQPIILPNGVQLDLIYPVVQVSPDKIMFLGLDKQVWMYRLSDSRLVQTGIRNCIPSAWRSRTHQLVCRDWNTWSTYLVNLNSGQRENVSVPLSANGVIYVPEYDVLLYSQSRWHLLISETYDIFLYDFHSKQADKVWSNAHIATGIWLPAR